jgi:hypothetical protein
VIAVPPVVELVELEYHWYKRVGVPPVAVTVSGEKAIPTHTAAGVTGLTVIAGSATTVTAAIELVAVPQPSPVALAVQ